MLYDMHFRAFYRESKEKGGEIQKTFTVFKAGNRALKAAAPSPIPAPGGAQHRPQQQEQALSGSLRYVCSRSRRRSRSVPLSSAPMMSTIALMYSQISSTITVPMEPYSSE